MRHGIQSQNQPMPLVLTPLQRAVLETLRGKETAEYPLSDWYLSALYALDNYHNPDRVSQAAQSLRELVEKLPRIVRTMDAQSTAFDFAGMRRQIDTRLLKDKEHYPEGWEGQVIDNHLDETLRKVERYVERNHQPTRREQMQRVVADIDPMGDQLDSRIREEKRDRLHSLWQKLEGFAHHNIAPDIEDFERYLETLEKIIIDLLAPITAQNQNEIQSILKRSDRSESDIKRMLALIESRGANFAFFFSRVTENADATWLPILKKKGYFAHPPNVEPTGDGRAHLPLWWPLCYLAAISDHAPDEVIKIVSQLPKVDNPRVYNDILDIALRLRGEQSAKLKPKMLEYAGIEYQFSAHRYAEVLAHWAADNQTSAALELSKALVQFVPGPQSQEKQARRQETPERGEMILQPTPRFDECAYQKILDEGVRPLAEKEPYNVARLLIDAATDKGIDKLFSDVWPPRLVEEESNPQCSEAVFIRTLTFACEQVYEQSPESVSALDTALRNQRWKIFKRLRQHLYALHPNEQTKPWIREMILAHGDYAQWEHRYEFQKMIRCACERFGATLLTEEDRTRIFDTVLIGPSKTRSQEFMGERFTEEDFQQCQCHFHRRQLRPFASLLFGEYLTYVQKLDVEDDKPISDEDYPPSPIREQSIIHRSPQSAEDLANLSDKELFAYINEWQEEHDNMGDYRAVEIIQITIRALAKAFQTVFKESIIPEAGRLDFWIKNRERIERPIYVAMMINGMQECVKAKNLDRLDEWLTFCEWVLSRPNQEHEKGVRTSDEFKENPDWHSARRAVIDFVETCLKENVPVSNRAQLSTLLELLCAQFDGELDQDSRVLLIHNDLLDQAINKTRSRALQALINFGFWVRRHDADAEVAEVVSILEKRFNAEAEYPLMLPEYAILGVDYSRIFSLDQSWATEHKSDFFPQNDLPAWLAAFDTFISYSRPFKPIFEILRSDFDFALEHLTDFNKPPHADRDLTDRLGRHLFSYYL